MKLKKKLSQFLMVSKEMSKKVMKKLL